MLFNSFDFILFLIVVLLLFVAIRNLRWVILLFASYFFYTYWKVEYALLIVLSTVVDYFVGLAMHKAESASQKKRLLYLSIAVNIGVLFFFKYFNFFNENLDSVLGFFGFDYVIPYSHLLLPVGISFYTFQTLSYTIDIYNGKIKPERHFGYFALFVSFFPQLVAGPIERAGRLIGQLKETMGFRASNILPGLRLMLWGYFKKVVIADRLALFVDPVYDAPGEYGSISLIIATIFFAFQIYCDFSGYSDIAIGVARLFGVELMKNFERPYLSSSIGEFWKRWHISLSSWFRDYVYIPLGGNKVVKYRWCYNLMITFVVSGLWHGANWTFIFWGLLHGIYLIGEKLLSVSGNALSAIKRGSHIVVTFGLVCFAWIFFRANDLSDAFLVIENILDLNLGYASFYVEAVGTGISKLNFVLSFFYIGFLVMVEFLGPIGGRPFRNFIVEYLFYYFLLFSIIFFGVDGQEAFIYFQF